MKKDIALIYNPVTKQMAPLVCDICGQTMYRIGFTSNLQRVCGTCHVCREVCIG